MTIQMVLPFKLLNLVFEYLEKSVKTADPEAREKMHNASTMAGMAFANAFLGMSHSMAIRLVLFTTPFTDVQMLSCFHMLSVTMELVHLRLLHGLNTTTGKLMKNSKISLVCLVCHAQLQKKQLKLMQKLFMILVWQSASR